MNSFTNLSNRCEIPLLRAGRWSFETTSNEIYLTHPVLFPISIESEVHLVSDVDLYFEIAITFTLIFRGGLCFGFEKTGVSLMR